MSRSLIALLAAGLSAGVCLAEPAPKDNAGHDAAQADQARPKPLAELFPDEKKPELWIGSKAPDLKISQFLRGDSVTQFEPGRTYVVEFWATWCGPCVAAFPHLAELQKKHADTLTVIGVNIWEQATGAERVEMVTDFVKEHQEMAYTVALEEGTAMADTWMRPAGKNGIPAAFIVDGTGTIAWTGHPMGMDDALDQVIKGEHDTAAAEKSMWQEHLAMTGYRELRRAAAKSEWDRAHEVGAALAHEAFAQEPQGLNAVAWMMVNGEDVPEKCIRLAHESARKACEQTGWSEWMILDTYALAAFKAGDKAEAVKWQTKAVELAPAEAKAEVRAQLETFTAEG